ncbi:PREDICTED: protocadherin alpha-4-like [Nanorana parkeri]|uniref:protocadherin alpha-4-like n=1 Tax=Nanorana parkeri TaxID=125878 RepID=UPI00085446B4|nr:PREDICTED: protocadherin alpha-4-like [Nanorana parkeri]
MSLLICLTDAINGQISYAILEEQDHGTVIGNLAHDLRMDPKHLFNRKFQITYDTKIKYFEINPKTGTLYAAHKIDREDLCSSNVDCVIRLGIVIDMPLALYHIEIYILDLNDNAPFFSDNEIVLTIAESTDPGTCFPLEGAFDPDASSNSVCSYFMDPNDLFDIDSHISDYKTTSLVLVLKNALDREEQEFHILTLTATDCGTPKLSGTAQIRIQVQDANDNPPTFSSSVYGVSIPENYPKGTFLLAVNATDIDDGLNCEIEYSFSSIVPLKVQQLFHIDSISGVISLSGFIDYEEKTSYEIQVQAKDHGPLPLMGHCKVIVVITDVNDNPPEIKVTSLSSIVKEDAEPGFVIALLTVTDKDSGKNGQVTCQIPTHFPFVLQNKFSNYYSLVLKNALDRESVSEYNISIKATDSGFPCLSSNTSISFVVFDVNDNPPLFTQSTYSVSVQENVLPGTPIAQISALDLDSSENARISYFLLPKTAEDVSFSLITINSISGKITSVKSLDYEKMQMFCVVVEARDNGTPPLSSTACLTVFIQDQNDNSPQVLPSLSTVEVWRSAKVGHVVTKLKAFDRDSGYNAWLKYEIASFTNSSLFRLGLYTGDITVARMIEETDGDLHSLLISITDHGEPPKSTMTVVTITILRSKKEELDENVMLVKDNRIITNFNGHLIVAISFISSIFLLIGVSYTGLKYFKAFRSIERHARSEDLSYMNNDWTLIKNKNSFTPLYFNTQSANNTILSQSCNYLSDAGFFGGRMQDEESTYRADSQERDAAHIISRVNTLPLGNEDAPLPSLELRCRWGEVSGTFSPGNISSC